MPTSQMNKSENLERLTAKKQKRDMESLACRGTAQKNHLSVIFEKTQEKIKLTIFIKLGPCKSLTLPVNSYGFYWVSTNRAELHLLQRLQKICELDYWKLINQLHRQSSITESFVSTDIYIESSYYGILNKKWSKVKESQIINKED